MRGIRDRTNLAREAQTLTEGFFSPYMASECCLRQAAAVSVHALRPVPESDRLFEFGYLCRFQSPVVQCAVVRKPLGRAETRILRASSHGATGRMRWNGRRNKINTI